MEMLALEESVPGALLPIDTALEAVADPWIREQDRHNPWFFARQLGQPQPGKAKAVAPTRLDLCLPRPDAYSVEFAVKAHLSEPEGPVHYVENSLICSLFGLLSHLIAEDGGYLTTLVATHDLLQVLDDDDNMRPLGSVLATALASEVRDAIASGAPVQVDGSVADQTVELLRQFAALDANDTLPELLARAVTPRSDTDVSTPMDTLLDVIAEVNRTAPHTQTPFRAADHTVLFHEVSDFLLDPERGLERLYAVVQSREGE